MSKAMVRALAWAGARRLQFYRGVPGLTPDDHADELLDGGAGCKHGLRKRRWVGGSSMKRCIPFHAPGRGRLFCALAVVFVTCGIVSAADMRASAALSPAVQNARYAVTSLPSAHAFPNGAAWVMAPGQQGSGLAWLDNRRVMFIGFVPDRLETKGLYVWDVIGNEVSQYSNHDHFCYAQGHIVAQEVREYLNDFTLRPTRYGSLGHEKNDVCDIKTKKGCLGMLNMSCKPKEYLDQHPLGPESSATFELRSGDGVLVTMVAIPKGAKEPTTVEEWKKLYSRPLRLLNQHHPKGRPLPIIAIEDLLARSAAYSPYAKRYVFFPNNPIDGQPRHSTNWPQGRPQPVYLMNADGDVETIQVPSRSDWTDIILALPALPGLVFKGSGGYANDWGGLFLKGNREIWALDRGRVETFAVSPDGCRVAWAIINDYGKTRNVRFNRIKSINFCEGGK